MLVLVECLKCGFDNRHNGLVPAPHLDQLCICSCTAMVPNIKIAKSISTAAMEL